MPDSGTYDADFMRVFDLTLDEAKVLYCPLEYSRDEGRSPETMHRYHSWQTAVVTLQAQGAMQVKLFSTCTRCRAFISDERENLIAAFMRLHADEERYSAQTTPVPRIIVPQAGMQPPPNLRQ